MVHVISRGKDMKCLDKSRTIVSNNFRDSTPSTEEVLKDKGCENGSGFGSQHMPFWVSGQSAACLNNVSIPTRARHKHGINMDPPEQSAHNGYGWRNPEAAGLVDLALVTSLDEPLDIVNHHRPLEVKQQAHADREDTLVPKVIMSLLY